MRYLTAGEIAYINKQEAGPDLLRDFGLLESAALRPQTSVGGQDAFPDIHSKAAALLHGIVANHPFIDGNKRTGLLAVIAFYSLNAWVFDGPDEPVYELVMDIAQGTEREVHVIAGRLKAFARRMRLPEDE